MAKISTYPDAVPPALNDYVIGTDVSNADATKSFVIADVLALGGTQTNKTQKIVVSQSELLNLLTTPKLLLSNENGKVKIITSLYLHKNAGTPYGDNYGFSIINQFGQNMFPSMSNSYMSYPQELDGVYDFSNSMHGWDTFSVSDLWIGRSFYLKSDSYNMVNGTGDLNLYFNYLEITL